MTWKKILEVILEYCLKQCYDTNVIDDTKDMYGKKKDSDNTEFKRDWDELNFECKDFEEYNKCILFIFSFLHECTKTIFRMGKWV